MVSVPLVLVSSWWVYERCKSILASWWLAVVEANVLVSGVEEGEEEYCFAE